MDYTTDFQFRTLLRMVLELLRNSKSVEEAIEKIEKLLSDK